MAATEVFVSYSRSDAALVAPVVRLLRANRSLVFQDVDSIAPGKRWRGQIDAGLAAAQLVVVFWCEHARRSDEMTKEWSAAIAQGKDVLPLLLDATPLPAALAEFQWIDFRGTAGGAHPGAPRAPPTADEGVGSAPGVPAPAAAARWRYGFGALAAVLVAAIAFGLLWPIVRNAGISLESGPVAEAPMPVPAPSPVPGPPIAERPAAPPPASEPPIAAPKPSPLPPEAEVFDAPAFSPLLGGMAIALVFGMLWLTKWQARSRRRRAAQDEIGRRMAAEIEAEIVRRVAPGESTGQAEPAGTAS